MMHDLQNRYTGIHPDFWVELNEILKFERQQQIALLGSFVGELAIKEIHREKSIEEEIFEDYEELVDENAQLIEEIDFLYDTIDDLRYKLEVAEAVADNRLLEIIKLKASRLNDDAKTIKYGM